MKKKYIFNKIGLLFLTLTILSCTVQNTTINDTNSLTGTWNWISSTGGIAGVTHTPKTTGENIELKVTSDFKYAIYTNGIVSSQGTYKLEDQKCIHDNTIKKVVLFSNDNSMMIESINYLNLILADEYHDGFSKLYSRKPLL